MLYFKFIVFLVLTTHHRPAIKLCRLVQWSQVRQLFRSASRPHLKVSKQKNQSELGVLLKAFTSVPIPDATKVTPSRHI